MANKKKCNFARIGIGSATKRGRLLLTGKRVSEEKLEKVKQNKIKRIKEWKNWWG